MAETLSSALAATSRAHPHACQRPRGETTTARRCAEIRQPRRNTDTCRIRYPVTSRRPSSIGTAGPDIVPKHKRPESRRLESGRARPRADFDRRAGRVEPSGKHGRGDDCRQRRSAGTRYAQDRRSEDPDPDVGRRSQRRSQQVGGELPVNSTSDSQFDRRSRRCRAASSSPGSSISLDVSRAGSIQRRGTKSAASSW